jgi:hypothetical protein
MNPRNAILSIHFAIAPQFRRQVGKLKDDRTAPKASWAWDDRKHPEVIHAIIEAPGNIQDC